MKNFVLATAFAAALAIGLATSRGYHPASQEIVNLIESSGVTLASFNGTIVRTVVPPAATPNDGRDNFYAVMGGVAGQKAIVAVAPGSKGYHGGDWAFYSVTWNVAPYLLTSEAAVLVASASGDVTIESNALNLHLSELLPVVLSQKSGAKINI